MCVYACAAPKNVYTLARENENSRRLSPIRRNLYIQTQTYIEEMEIVWTWRGCWFVLLFGSVEFIIIACSG